jgi:hypothetical protein
MNTMEISFNIEDLITDLKTLRKSTGFKENRVFNTITFLHAIGGREQGFETIKTRFIAAISELSDNENIDLMLAAYALSSGYDDVVLLDERREKYGKKINKKANTLLDKEDIIIEELAYIVSRNHQYLPKKSEQHVVEDWRSSKFEHTSLSVKTYVKNGRIVLNEYKNCVKQLCYREPWINIERDNKTYIIPTRRMYCLSLINKNGSYHLLSTDEYHDVVQSLGKIYTFNYLEIPYDLMKINHKGYTPIVPDMGVGINCSPYPIIDNSFITNISSGPLKWGSEDHQDITSESWSSDMHICEKTEAVFKEIKKKALASNHLKKPHPTIDYVCENFSVPTLLYEHTVLFEGETPSMIWWFTNCPRNIRPNKPYPPKEPDDYTNIMKIRKDGSVKLRMCDLDGPMFSGIAWRW